MKKSLLLLLIFAAAFPVFASGSPDWINGISKQYQQKDYLIGVGVGDTLDSARSSARAEIAKVFKARISQSAQDMKSERTTQEGSSSKFSSRQDASLNTAVSTDELLQGVEIAETWLDEKKKIYYALAVLNKQKTRQALMHQISDQEELVSGKQAQAKSAESVIDKLRALNGALEAMNRKDELLVRKQVLDPVAVGDPSASGVRAGIERQKSDLLGKIRFIIQADDTPNLAARVAEKITGLGFTTVPSPPEEKTSDTVALKVTVGTAVAPVDRNNPQWKFYGWHGTVTITDAADNTRVISSVVKDGQSSHLTDDAAKTKAVMEAVQATASAVEQEITKYIFGN
jgi:hypothetical protein